MLILALNTLQITCITLLSLIVVAIITLVIVCLIRAARVPAPVAPKVSRLDNYTADPNVVAEKLSKLIQHKTVASFSMEKHCKIMHSAHDEIKTLFPNITKKCIFEDFGGGLLINWKGLSPDKPLMLMSHLDVVSDRGEWDIPAFEGKIKDGIVHGRGAVDTKGSLIAILEAVDSLIGQKYIPNRDVYIFASSREEIGGVDASLACSHLRDRGVYPYLVVDEGGAILDAPLVGVKGKFAMIAMAETANAHIVLSATSKGNMSGMARIANFITKCQKLNLSKSSFSPEVKAMFKTLLPHMNFPMRCLFANFPLFQDLLLGILPKVSREAKAMLGARLSFSPAELSALKSFPLGTGLVSANISTTYYQNLDDCVEKFMDECKKYGISAILTQDSRHTVAPEPIGSDGYNAVSECIRAVFPNVTPCPFISFGGTDSRHFVSLADSVIRFAPLALTTKEYHSFHNVNEQIHADSVAHAVEFYRELILRIPQPLSGQICLDTCRNAE